MDLPRTRREYRLLRKHHFHEEIPECLIRGRRYAEHEETIVDHHFNNAHILPLLLYVGRLRQEPDRTSG